jgi:hypothetical protein
MGHIFDFAITPSPRSIAFADWDTPPNARLISDPLAAGGTRALEPMPDAWRDFLTRSRPQETAGWTLHDADTAYRVSFDEGEFLVLAERAGNEFVLHRLEPPASTMFYLESHDGEPRPIRGGIADLFRPSNI